LYELFTKLGGNIKSNFGKKIIFAPQERKNDVLVFLPDNQITRESMMGFVKDVLGSMPKKIFLPEVEVRKVVSIEEMLDKLANRIKDTLKMSFREFAGQGKGGKEEKVVMIVSFLALLELIRQGIIHAVQEIDGEDIIMEEQEARR
jgi:chromatin segregation and condensation protein Rec8/ScpA/Scc1 (kleisin family)